MKIGVVGRKCGMTRVFQEDGSSVPVTVLEVEPNRIAQIKGEVDGYNAVQVTVGQAKASRLIKPLAGHYAKANTPAGKGLWEFRLEQACNDLELGAELTVEQFDNGDWVDVTATSKGKGFAGVVKRHNFRTQDATHGNSLSHRAPGSIGQNQSPGRVFKGKKMAGQMGNVRVTTQNLEVIRIDADRNMMLIKGAVPGAPGGYVIIKPAVKKRKQEEN